MRTLGSFGGRPERWLGCAMMVALLAVLLALTLVINQAVDAGSQRRAAQAELTRATWQCKMPLQASSRAACLAALQATAPERAGSMARPTGPDRASGPAPVPTLGRAPVSGAVVSH
jgi:hypothetical protein